jgi:hypothetical protein
MKDFLFGVVCIAAILFAYGLAAHLDEKDEIAYRLHQLEKRCGETKVQVTKEKPRVIIIGCENDHD